LRNSTVFARKTIAVTSLLALLALFSVLMHGAADAQSRWPPWQSYGEAEDSSRKKPRKARPGETALLNRQIAQLKAAGKYAEAIPLAQKALALAEKKGATSPDVANALDTLASLYEAQNNYAEAEPLLKRSLAIREQAPGQPGVAASRERLAVTYDKLGRAADAQATRGKTIAVGKGAGEGAAMREAPSAEVAVKEKAAEEAKKAAEAAMKAAEEDLARKQAEQAQAKQEPAKPAKPDAPLPRYSARPVEPQEPAGGAAPPDAAPTAAAPEDPATVQIPAADSAGSYGGASTAEAPPAAANGQPHVPEPPVGTPSSDAGEMTPGAPAPETVEIPAADGAAPPPEGAFGGAPPPVAEAAPPADDEVDPPPVAAAAPPPSAAAPVPSPPLPGAAEPAAPDPKDAVGRGRSAPRMEAARAPSAAAPKPVTAAPSGGGAAAPSAGPEGDWQVVPVYWGTDRAVQPNAQRLVFGSDRARKLQLGMAEITVPKVHEVPNVERPWVVKIPYFDVTIYAEKEDAKKHFTVKEIKALSREELLALVKARLKGSKIFKDQALVFVHGYNTSFDNALYRTAQIAYDLDFDGAPFLYSWPSGGAVASYTYDRESAQASEPYLREFLQMVVKETGAKQVSIIAHSMGNQPVMDVLRDMRDAAPEGVEISQVILAAPDVDADSFSNLAKAIQGLAKNVTLYVAGNDRALIVSRNFWGSYRAGDVPPAGPLILPGIDTIDVTAASTDTFAINHSGYAANNKLLDDVGELLKTGLRPPAMRVLKPDKVTTQAGDYWKYVPSASAAPAVTGSPP
jgi:esterase/lipase superfamily enzyme/tetratricopeptide (TPR) repeat protein